MKKRFFAIITLLLMLFVSGCTVSDKLPTVEDVTYSESQTLKDIALPQDYKWKDETTVPTVDVEYYTAILTQDGKEKFVNIKINVLPATPSVTVKPTANVESLVPGDVIPEIIQGTASTEGVFTWVNPETKLAFGKNVVKWTFEPSNKNYLSVNGESTLIVGRNVIINVLTSGATLVVKQGEKVVEAVDGLYVLENELVYTYTVSKEGYYSKTSELPLTGGVVNVELEKIPAIVTAREEAIKELNSLLDKTLYYEDQVKEIEAILTNAAEDINQAETEEAVAELTKNAKKALNNVYTKTQYDNAIPSIRLNIEEGKTYASSKLVFDAFIQDKNGSKLSMDKVVITLNGVEVDYVWDDSIKTSYEAKLTEYENTLVVKVTNGPVVKEQTYHFFFVEKPVTITISIDALSIGSGYVVEPMQITFDDELLAEMATMFKMSGVNEMKEKLNAAYALAYVIKSHGYDLDHTGKLDSGFYLSAIYGFHHSKNVPAEIQSFLDNNGITVEDPYSYDELGEFDYTYQSGWMYTIANVLPNVGMAQYTLQDGDIMRVQFTIAYGSDIATGFDGNGWFNHNKDGLTAAIAKANTLNIKNVPAYQAAMELIQTFGHEQKEFDDAEALLLAAIDSELALRKAKEEAVKTINSMYTKSNYYPAQQVLAEELINQYVDLVKVSSTQEILTKTLETFNTNFAEIPTKQQVDDEPIIELSIEEGKTYGTKKLLFDAFIQDKYGRKILPSQINITLNSKPVSLVWDDSLKTSYEANLKDYENELVVTVKNGACTKTVKYHFFFVESPAKITISVDAFSLGCGYVVEPVSITFDEETLTDMASIFKFKDAAEMKEKLSAAYVLAYVLTKNGYEWDNQGKLESGFYLAYIIGFKHHNNIPEELLTLLEKNKIRIDDPYSFDELGEFDYTNRSGWMFTVNNVLPNVGMSDWTLQDGDVMRVQFTIAYGADIATGFDGKGWFNTNKDRLSYAIALANEIHATYLNEYKTAMELIQRFAVTQQELDEAADKLIARIEPEKPLVELKLSAIEYINSVDYNLYYDDELQSVKYRQDYVITLLADAKSESEVQEGVKFFKYHLRQIETKDIVDSNYKAAKNNALNKIAGIDLNLYEGENLQKVQDLIATCKEAINAGYREEQVSDAMYTFQQELNKVPHLEPVEALRKQALIYINSIDASLYRPEEQAKLETARTKALQDVNAAQTEEDIHNAMRAFKQVLQSLPTKQALEEQLAKAKSDFKQSCDEIDRTLYDEAGKVELEALITEYVAKINATETIDDFVLVLREFKTKLQVIPQNGQLPSLKAEALEFLNSFDKSQYYPIQVKEIDKLIATATATINAAQTEDEVNNAIRTFRTAASQVPNKDAVDAQNLLDNKTYAYNLLASINLELYAAPEREQLQSLINATKTKVDNAQTVEEIEVVIRDFKRNGSQIPTDPDLEALYAYKQEAINYLGSFNLNLYNAPEQEQLKAIIASSTEKIKSASTKLEVNDFIREAKANIAQVKTSEQIEFEGLQDNAIKAINGYDTITNYYDEQSQELVKIQTQAVAQIKKATTAKEVMDIVRSTRDRFAAVKTKEQVDADFANFIVEAKEFVLSIDPSIFAESELEKFKAIQDKTINSLESTTTISEAQDVIRAYRTELSKLQQK